MHSLNLKIKAAGLRKRGKTHREIANLLSISTSTACIWTKDVTISYKQKIDIEKRRNKPYQTLAKKSYLITWARTVLAKINKKHSAESLLNKIRKFVVTHGRIPMKREFNMYGEYKRYFKSWNEAIEEAGYTANKSIFSQKHIAQDGHVCDSFSEKVIDDYLYMRRIQHIRNAAYTGTKYTADFLIGANILVEFFGLKGISKHYDATISKKRSLAKRLGFYLVELYPEDLFE